MVNTATDLAVSGVNQAYRPRHSALPHDKAMSLKCLDHRIYRGRRQEKVPLNVGFRRRDAKSEHVLFDELDVLALARGRQKGGRALVGTFLRCKVYGQLLSQPLDKERRAIDEMNGKPFVFARLNVRYAFSGNPLRNFVDVQN